MAETAVSSPPSPSSRKKIADFFDLGSNGRSAYATIITSSLLFFGAITLFVSYGTWLFEDYGLSASSLGRVALVMGLADLVGSVAVSVISDRYGKRLSVLTGATVACIGFWALPLLQATLITAVIGLVAARGAFEFAIVANMTLLSEQSPRHRAKTMTLGTAIASISTGSATWVSPWLFEQYGLVGLTAVAGTATFLSILMLLWAVREPDSLAYGEQS